MKDSGTMETISIKDENGKEYKFEKPDFECELLKIYHDAIIGTLIEEGSAYPMKWQLGGTSIGITAHSSYHLIPVKPKWYEDESNFIKGVIMVSENATGCLVVYNYGQYKEEVSRGFRVVTKEELLSLHYEGKEK